MSFVGVRLPSTSSFLVVAVLSQVCTSLYYSKAVLGSTTLRLNARLYGGTQRWLTPNERENIAWDVPQAGAILHLLASLIAWLAHAHLQNSLGATSRHELPVIAIISAVQIASKASALSLYVPVSTKSFSRAHEDKFAQSQRAIEVDRHVWSALGLALIESARGPTSQAMDKATGVHIPPEQVEKVLQKILSGNDLKVHRQASALAAEYIRTFAIEAIHRAAQSSNKDIMKTGLKQITIEAEHLDKISQELMRDF